MHRWISFDRVFDGSEIHTNAAVDIYHGAIADLAVSSGVNVERHVNGLLTPGFVDLQVNGGGGVLFNSSPTRKGIQAITDAHRSFGTTALVPTVISDTPDVLERAADAVIAARNDRGVIGIHIEGPHISIERRGTHAAEFIRPLDNSTIEVVQRLRNANVKVMITLAPEAAKTEQITQLVAMKAVVSIGHTNATAELVNNFFSAGASCATHLFNAMSPMTSREPGAVGAVINSHCFAGIICDGHHVADEMIGMAIRAKPTADKIFLVSDAMATVGGADSFELYGKIIKVQEGRLLNVEGNLAGAHITQAQGVQRLVACTGTALVDALKMATSIPAACIGVRQLGNLVGRALDDVIVLDNDLNVQGSLELVASSTSLR